jgi:signal peptidase I
MIISWFISSSVRQAVALRRHVHRLLCAQRDLLSAQAVEGLNAALAELQTAIRSGMTPKELKAEMAKLEAAANKWLKPYPFAPWRENVEVVLVALAVAMAIRTFFLQPFKIPTGSMQPTLYGVTSDYLINQPDVQIPTGWARFKDWIGGASYVHVVAKADGVIKRVGPMHKFLIFNRSQSFWIGNPKDDSPGVEHTMWFPPDYGEPPAGRDAFLSRAHLEPGHVYRKGDDVVKLRMRAGDHLFVDRLTYNFRKPTRGEIIVFETRGIYAPDISGVNQMPQDQFYIKRMVVLPGEHVQIGNDRHLRINGVRLDASTPHFENVYGFNPDQPPHESQWSGHVNGHVAYTYNLYPTLAPLFPDEETVYTNAPNAYMVMGDNTCNSFDSRTWGSFPTKNVIGKSFFVYWPITERFGVGNQ